ncbi:MAG: PRD domain-containing protein [Acetivibrio ethanolgignens]
MYRVTKVLNHNAVIVVSDDNQQEYMIMGKGAGFGKRVGEQIELRQQDIVYSLQESTERGAVKELAKSVTPVYLEIAAELLEEAKRTFGKIDQRILFPLADHLEFAVARIRKGEQISNPLTEDIRVLFPEEFKTAKSAGGILKNRLQAEISEDEIGYIALHIHSAIEDDKVSEAMQMARAVRECISLIEEEGGLTIQTASLSYNRLMNHIRYMIARAVSGEQLKVNMNDYMGVRFPKAFQMAENVCGEIEKNLKCELSEVEIGYLAMHIERVLSDEEKALV